MRGLLWSEAVGRCLLVKTLPSHGLLIRRCLATGVAKKTFENQDSMPRLPIPSLENMSDKYLKSLQPLLSKEELEKTSSIVQDFLQGPGPVLQQRLIDYDKTQENSWLEKIWLNKAYLEWREPSMINVNWWCQLMDSYDLNQHVMIHPPPKGTITEIQIDRAAKLIASLLDFKKLLETEKLPPDMARDRPMCMNQYKNQYGVTRVPGETADTIEGVYPCTAPYITVSVRNKLFSVPVLDGKTGERASVTEIKRLLYAASKNSIDAPAQDPVGVLTAGHRDTWYKAYKILTSDATNVKNLQAIKDSLFLVCLDDYALKRNIDVAHHQVFHGMNAQNRWFDKAIQLIVTSNGRAGVNGEHTPADAVIPGKMMDFIVTASPNMDVAQGISGLPDPTPLEFNVNEEVKKYIREAQETAQALIDDTVSCLYQTDVYGSRYIKEVAKCSPDAYIQMALQLAWARLQKEPTAIYETASARFFKHGRTETCRSLSSESWEFASNFDNINMLTDDKRTLFRKAIDSQVTYMKEASEGRGIDRHMLGLRCMVKEASEATLFQDPAYAKSCTFRLSTSNMSPGTNFYGGFGPVVANGYGINYAIDKDALKFSFSCKASCKEVNVFDFRSTLERALKDMMELFPLRAEVWGTGWQAKHEQERKEEAMLRKMKRYSDAYTKRKK